MRDETVAVRGACRRHWLHTKNFGVEAEAWTNNLLNPGAKDAIMNTTLLRWRVQKKGENQLAMFQEKEKR
jgi:hypothetical protein